MAEGEGVRGRVKKNGRGRGRVRESEIINKKNGRMRESKINT
jgi:hypothetical protein